MNIAVFRGKLQPPVEIEFIRHKKTWAWAHPMEHRRTRLTMVPYFPTKLAFLLVLVHEMVHAWEHHKDKNMTHGPEFYKWRPVVEKAHLELQLHIEDV